MVNFLLEIGTEELPADFVSSAIAQWQQRIPKNLTAEFLVPETIEIYGTPRRLAILLKGLPEKQPDREEEIKGPPVQAAFKDGKPTKAAEGFASKQGVDVAALTVRETDKGEFIFVRKKTVGRDASAILQELIPQWIVGLEGRRFMRWGDGDLRFPRPIRTLIALLDDRILPVELVSGSTRLESSRISTGHRILHPEPITIPTASDYVEVMRRAFVEVVPELRRQKIVKEIETAAAKLGGVAEIPADLLAEVIDLVEYPTAVIGKFEEEFLKLPDEVITTVMVTHQRYFPVRRDDRLLPNFITISNGDPNKAEIIAAGNGRVIRARLADGQFFYKADCEKPLADYLLKLEAVTFQEDLGSIRDKTTRIINVCQQLCQQLNLSPEVTEEITRTALLCKADLVSQMVYEFPELQGVMGEKYATVSGETTAVARGIFEHYLPRNVEDCLPETLTGQIVGIADRMDTLVSIFGLGMLPSGSSDPFALRRAANSIINISWQANLGIELDELIDRGSTDFLKSHQGKESPQKNLEDFFVQRLRTLLQDELAIDYDLVNAVLGETDVEYRDKALRDLLDLRDRALFLQSIRSNGDLDKIYETVNRSTRLAVKGDLNFQELDAAKVVKSALFEKQSERIFYEAMLQLLPKTQIARNDRNYQLLVAALIEVAPLVSNFFDGEDSVLVMAEDEKIRQNRLNLLGILRNHARVLADFGAIVK
jgi:glycyl-tRNA synthetase beta chain